MTAADINELLTHGADVYTPLLLALALGVATVSVLNGQRWYWVRLPLSAVLVYGMMFADNHWQWWLAAGLDYSTHTAAALALVVFIGVGIKSRSVRLLLGASLLAYGELMFYLGYHSWVDMGSTAAVIAVGLWIIYRFPYHRL
jgi:hypothetical protein